MSFQLFFFKVRRFIGTAVRLSRGEVIGFCLDGLWSDLRELFDAFETNRDDWTDEQSEQAGEILDQINMRMTLDECHWEYQTSNCCNDSVGNYCLN